MGAAAIWELGLSLKYSKGWPEVSLILQVKRSQSFGGGECEEKLKIQLMFSGLAYDWTHLLWDLKDNVGLRWVRLAFHNEEASCSLITALPYHLMYQYQEDGYDSNSWDWVGLCKLSEAKN